MANRDITKLPKWAQLLVASKDRVNNCLQIACRFRGLVSHWQDRRREARRRRLRALRRDQ